MIAIPNVSEGRDALALLDIQEAMSEVDGVDLLAQTVDPDHHRSVIALIGRGDALVQALVAGARAAAERIDLRTHDGVHPRVGGLDVAPFVYLGPDDRELATACALATAEAIGNEVELPVFLYGELAGGRTRASLRRGGPAELDRRVRSGELAPDAGPSAVDPARGAVLVAARPQLAGLNVELAADHTLAEARAIAARIREGGEEGLPSVRALGLPLPRRGIVQVSTMIEDAGATTAGQVVEAVAQHAQVTGAELVAPAPAAAFVGFPADVPLTGAGLARL